MIALADDIETLQFAYTPQVVERWFKSWPELEALALNPQTARGLLESGPTREVPRLAKQEGHHSDPMLWANVHADLVKAWRSLPQGLPLQTVWACTRGIQPHKYAARIQRRRVDVVEAFELACRQMARYLGWVEEECGDE